MMRHQPVLAAISSWPKKFYQMAIPGRSKIEYFRLNIEYLRSAYCGSILKGAILKMTERSDFHKYSICNLQFSISVSPGEVHNAEK
jgi:putative hemolysin